MKSLLLSGLILMSLTVEAHDKDRDDHQRHHGGTGKHHEKHQEFEVIPLNSPVKEAKAKFRLSIPSGQDVKSVFYKIESSSKIEDQLLLKKTEIALVSGNQIEIPVSRFAPGNYEVKFWVKLKKGDERNCQHKKKDEVPFVIDSSLEVADPGEAGMKTLLGIDDGKGVRADIARYIAETYPNKESTKKALRQMAVAMGLKLANVDNKELSIKYSHDIGEAIGCLTWIDFKDGPDRETPLRKKFYNTPERIKAKMKASTNFHGQGTSERKKSLDSDQWNQLCNFTATQND